MIAGNFSDKKNKKRTLAHLRREERHLTVRLGKISAQISQAEARKTAPISLTLVDQWLNELGDGLPDLPPLPADFSRADIYDDHD